MPKKTCLVSIDVEEEPCREKTFLGVEKLGRVLEIFGQFDIKATLFVTGEVLETYPHLVENWAQTHEIACHNYRHVPLYNLRRAEREKQLEDFCKLYERVLGVKPRGFRAPQYSIDNEQIKLLEKFDFVYDSSAVPTYPFFRKYPGYKGRAPKKPYHPNHEDYRKEGDMTILEVPLTPLAFGIPLTGTWVRILGTKFYDLLLILNKPKFVNLMLHSWDCVDYHGAYSRNSGEKFLPLLRRLLETLSDSYVFTNGMNCWQEKQTHEGRQGV